MNNNKAVWENWKMQAKRMEEWFMGRSLPKSPLRMNDYSVIHDLKKYVETNLAQVKNNQDKPWMAPFKPAYMRLFHLKKFIENAEDGTTNGKS